MATTGAKYATNTQWWDSAWTNYGNIADNNYSNYAIAMAMNSAYQICLAGFDFSSIPQNASISSFTVSFKGGLGQSYQSGSKTSVYFYLGTDYVKQSTRDGTYTGLNANPIYLVDEKIGKVYDNIYSYTSTSADTATLQLMTQNLDKIRSGNFCFDLYAQNARVYYVTVDLTYSTSVTISTDVSPSGSGSVSGGGSYAPGTSVTLTATPSTGYQFKQWQDSDTSNPRTITASNNATYTATFALKSYAVSTAVSPSGSGSVSGGGTYNHGSTATLTATPATGYQFIQWLDGNTDNPRTINVSGDISHTAIFQPKAYTIYLKDDEGNSLGSVTAIHGSSPVITTTPTKQPSGGATYTFREWNTQRDGSGTAYTLNGLPAATGSTTYFAQFDATYSEPDIASITVAPNPATGGQGVVITVVFET